MTTDQIDKTTWYYQGEFGDWFPCSAWLAADLATSNTGPNGGPHPVRLGVADA